MLAIQGRIHRAKGAAFGSGGVDEFEVTQQNLGPLQVPRLTHAVVLCFTLPVVH
jgi:hypothetical protein